MTPAQASPAVKTRVVVFATLYPPAFRGGGPIRTLEALLHNAPVAYDVRVVTRDTDQGGERPLDVEANAWSEWDGVPVWYASAKEIRSAAAAMASARAHRPELVYVNSFFDFPLSIVPQVLRKLGYLRADRLLVAPRGEFGIAAISSKSHKKKLFVALYRVLGLHRDVVWHASSVAEKVDIERVWGPSAKVIVRENDTLLPANSDRSGVPETADGESPPFSLVSIGRLVEHKGVHLVLEALQKAPMPVHLDVFGPDEDEVYAARCRALAEQLPRHVAVRFFDALPHELVRRTLSRYDALIMPTAGENFGHVIAESLSVACPVICSDTTPWSAVLREGGGVVVPERTSQAWRAALDEYMHADTIVRRDRRDLAGMAYDSWKSRSAVPHVFELVLPDPGA